MSAGTRFQPLREGLLPFGRRHRGSFVKGLAFTCLLAASRLALPLPLTAVVEESSKPAQQPAAQSGWADPVALFSAAFVSLALVAGMAEHYQRLAFAHFAGRSISDARSAAIARIGRDGPGDTTAQVMADSARTKVGLKGLLNHIILNGLLVLGVCVALGVADLRLGLVQFAGTLVLVALAVAGASRAAVMAAEHRHGEAHLAAAVQRFVGGQSGRDIGDLMELRRFDASSGDADTSMTRWEGRTTWAVHVILAMTAAVVLVLGVHAADTDQLSTGALFTVVAYLLVIHGPAVRFARQITRVGPLLVSADHLGRALIGEPSRRPWRGDEAAEGLSSAGTEKAPLRAVKIGPSAGRHRSTRGRPVSVVDLIGDVDSVQAGRHRRLPLADSDLGEREVDLGA